MQWYPVPRRLLMMIVVLALPLLVVAVLVQLEALTASPLAEPGAAMPGSVADGGPRLRMSWLAAPFLLAFGLFKLAWGMNAGCALAEDGDEARRLIAGHGSRKEVQRWIRYKYLSAVVAFFGFGLCLVLAALGR